MHRVLRRIFACVLLGGTIVLLITFAHDRSIIEGLSDPQIVVGRTRTGLVLEGGTQITLNGVREINPETETPFLNTACANGIEINDGRAIGLVKIHHWCGNDPVRRHLARVDLADLVLYVGEATGAASVIPERSGRSLTDSGWNISDYVMFRTWCRHPKNVLPPAPLRPQFERPVTITPQGAH